MKTLKLIAVLALGALVSACASMPDIASRNAPFETQPNDQQAALAAPKPAQAERAAIQALKPAAAPVAKLPEVAVQGITVTVPRTLKVSEANRYLPKGDIVWREDPRGDRYVQVQKIVADAMAKGTADMTNGTPVTLDIQVMRFHALTEKTRYTVGGIHSIAFALTVRDARTGAALGPRRIIETDLEGYGGQKAINAIAHGQTQKVRITQHLARTIHDELTLVGGYQNANLGLIQALNKL